MIYIECKISFQAIDNRLTKLSTSCFHFLNIAIIWLSHFY